MARLKIFNRRLNGVPLQFIPTPKLIWKNGFIVNYHCDPSGKTKAYMVEIIEERDEWGELISGFEDSDFYHTYDYHQVSKNPKDKAILFKYSGDGLTIALPLLIREIEGSSYYDATSVYGYPGPLIYSDSPTFDAGDFKKELNAYLIENKVVSVFSRLNPFIPLQEYLLKGMGEIISPGNIINIDLTKDMESQLREYHKRLRTYINKSRRLFTIKKAKSKSELATFIELYHDNMRRVDAKPKYFFAPEYFYKMFGSDSFESELLFAISDKTKEIVAGAWFIKKNRIVQYHLSGVRDDHLKLNPVKMLIDEMRIRARREGYTYFNLGGGVANKEDSLYQFKQGFSHDIKPFNVWRYIVNKKVYDELVKRKAAYYCALSPKPCNDFFPCYRCESPLILK